jgi:capsular polysaccharide biosynthesis protein
VGADAPPRTPTADTDPPPRAPTVESESPPRAPTMLDVLRRRSWLVALVTVLAIASAAAYSRGTPPRYQATATVLAHPSAAVTKASDYSTDLSLLSYGSLEQTFVSLARSSKLLDQAASGMGFTAAERKQYSAVANLLPASTVLEISVTGPDRDAVVTLANTLSAAVSAATRQFFPIFALTPLDPAVRPSLQVEPRTRQNLLFGGLAGLIAGFVVATLSLRVRRRSDGGPTGSVAAWRRFRNAPSRSRNQR